MALNRRLRGILGIATTWGVAFSGLSLGMIALGIAAGPIRVDAFGVSDFLMFAVRGFLGGGLAGALFASFVARGERGTSVSAMSDERMALWGFLGCAPIPAISVAVSGLAGLNAIPFGMIVAATVTYGALGGAMGAATLRLARRAPELRAGDDAMSGALPPASQAR